MHKDNPIFKELNIDTEVLMPIIEVWNECFADEEMMKVTIREEKQQDPDPVDQFVYNETIFARDQLLTVKSTFDNLTRLIIEGPCDEIAGIENELKVLS